jgi:hypothetical protein
MVPTRKFRSKAGNNSRREMPRDSPPWRRRLRLFFD